MIFGFKAKMYYVPRQPLYNSYVTPYKGHMDSYSPIASESKVPHNGGRNLVARIGLKVLDAFWPALMRFGSPKLTADAILSEDAYEFHCANARYACGESIGVEPVVPHLTDRISPESSLPKDQFETTNRTNDMAIMAGLSTPIR